MTDGKLVRIFLPKVQIYDLELASKVREQLEKEMLLQKILREETVKIGPDYRYQIEIVFSEDVYETDEFYSFPVSKETPIQSRGRKYIPESERKKQKICDILSEQQKNIIKVFEEAEIHVCWCMIVGQENLPLTSVLVFLYTYEPEEKPGEKKKATNGRVCHVMPSRSAYYENWQKVGKILEESRKRKQKEKEEEGKLRDQHIPNLVDAEKLFSGIARSRYPSDNDKANSYKEMLYQTAVQVMGGPLQLRSRNKTEAASAIDKDTKLDCPEYLMYTQYTTGGWKIEKVENLKSAQANILHSYSLKRTEQIIVLHNLKAVPYSLFKGTDEGLVVVPTEKARGEKKLYLSWNK